jgi:rod shape-determining protein MreD
MMLGGRMRFWFFSISLVVSVLLHLVLLPDMLSAARPLWLPLMIAYWALVEPRAPVLAGAFISGIAMDVLFNSALGQHALGLVLMASTVSRMRPIFILFPLWQATLALAPAWMLYIYLMFWIDTTTHHQADLWLRWLPVVSTTLFWPLVFALMEAMRGRNDSE